MERYGAIRRSREMSRFFVAWKDHFLEIYYLQKELIYFCTVRRLRRVFNEFKLRLREYTVKWNYMRKYLIRGIANFHGKSIRCFRRWKLQARWEARRHKILKMGIRGLKLNRLMCSRTRLRIAALVLKKLQCIAANKIQRCFRYFLGRYRFRCNILIKRVIMKHFAVWILRRRRGSERIRKVLEEECFKLICKRLLSLRSQRRFFEVVSCMRSFFCSELKMKIVRNQHNKQYFDENEDHDTTVSTANKVERESVLEELKPFFSTYFRNIFRPLYICKNCYEIFLYKNVKSEHSSLCVLNPFRQCTRVFQKVPPDSASPRIASKIISEATMYKQS